MCDIYRKVAFFVNKVSLADGAIPYDLRMSRIWTIDRYVMVGSIDLADWVLYFMTLCHIVLTWQMGLYIFPIVSYTDLIF